MPGLELEDLAATNLSNQPAELQERRLRLPRQRRGRNMQFANEFAPWDFHLQEQLQVLLATHQLCDGRRHRYRPGVWNDVKMAKTIIPLLCWKRAAQAAGQCRGWKRSRCRRGGGQEEPPALWLMKQRSSHLGSSIDPLLAFCAGFHCPQICKTCALFCSRSELQLLLIVGRGKRRAVYWKVSQ